MGWLRLRRWARKVRRFRPGAAALEDRRIPGVGGLTATVEPALLAPPSGRYVPVTIKGTVHQSIVFDLPGHPTEPPSPEQRAKIDAANNAEPPPAGVSIHVVDDFWLDQPHLRAALRLTGKNSYFSPASNPKATAYVALTRDFSFTKRVYLRASTLVTHPINRHYYVTVAVSDNEGSTGKTLPVLVPSPAGSDYPLPRGPLGARHGPGHRLGRS